MWICYCLQDNSELPENRNKTPNLRSVGPNQGLDYVT